jgi:hypothetical protein
MDKIATIMSFDALWIERNKRTSGARVETRKAADAGGGA